MKKPERNEFDLIHELMSEEEFVDNYIYLTTKSRGAHCSELTLRRAYRERTAAKLIKRLDPILYYTK